MMKKIWLITGISSGLGKAIAQTAMDQGDFVMGTFRSSGHVDAFNSACEGKGRAVKMDVTRADDVVNVVAEVMEHTGRIDVLVNNAGYGMAGAIEETSDDETRASFEANFFGSLRLTRAVLPLMRAQRSGHIIQISSHGGVKAFGGFGIYCATKFALEGLSEALAQEVQPLGINVTIVEPGPFRTGFAGRRLVMAENEIADYKATAGTFRQKLKGVDGKQEGDPEKAATAIYTIAGSASPPLRLPLGKTALATINAKLESVRNDLKRSEEVAETVVY